MKIEMTPGELRDLCRVLALSGSDYETRRQAMKAIVAEAMAELTKAAPA